MDDPITHCNICGSTNLYARRKQLLCAACHSDARSRLIWLILTERHLLEPGQRLLHFAPERCLVGPLGAILGDGYEPVDIAPENFADVPGIRRFDLATDAARLASGQYDLILHSHVMEHISCNVTAVLYHLHRALKPGGRQLCSIPIARDAHYTEALGPLSGTEATERFGQADHVRMFGDRDIQATLGMLFRLPDHYDLLDRFDAATLDAIAIHADMRTGWSPNSVLLIEKDDLLLVD
jgi:phosphoglycolate phosphatase